MPRCEYCGGADTSTTAPAAPSTAGRSVCTSRATNRGCATAAPWAPCPTAAPRRSPSPATEWRILLPLGLADNTTYHALKAAHKETSFYSSCSRYTVAGNDFGSRPRVRATPIRELRAASGLLIEWFHVCVRHGWLTILGQARRNDKRPVRRSDKGWLERVRRARARRATTLPYGRYVEKARTLG